MGVLDIPYSNVPAPKTKTGGARQGGKAKARKASTAKIETTTTGEVAEWLENKYHLMEVFYLEYENEFADVVANGYAGAMETAMMSGHLVEDPLAGAASELEESFRYFITSQEVEGLGIPGTPTKAALEGKSSRFKSGHGPRRPSFIDTGQYVASFKTWFDYTS